MEGCSVDSKGKVTLVGRNLGILKVVTKRCLGRRRSHICLQHQGRIHRQANTWLDFGFCNEENMSAIDMVKEGIKDGRHSMGRHWGKRDYDLNSVLLEWRLLAGEGEGEMGSDNTEEGRRGQIRKWIACHFSKLRFILEMIGTHGNILSCRGSWSNLNLEAPLRSDWIGVRLEERRSVRKLWNSPGKTRWRLKVEKVKVQTKKRGKKWKIIGIFRREKR